MSNYFLVATPVRDLAVGEWIMDEHGGRSITTIRRDGDRSFIAFSEGPSAWYLNVEMLPTERMA